MYASENLLYKGVAGTYNTSYNAYANTYTFIKGITSDINGDTVDQVSSGTQSVTWTLLSPVAAANTYQSLLVVDPTYIFGDSSTTGMPKFGEAPVKTVAEALAAGKAARSLSINLAGDGNAYSLLVTDRIGGGGGVGADSRGILRYGNMVSHHVFPVEKTTTFAGNYTEGTDSLTTFLLANNVDRGNISDYVGGIKDNGRGFNKLIATFQGSTFQYTYDGPSAANTTTGKPAGKREIIYHVIPDTTQDLRVAWLDMSGDYFASATGDLNDRTELRGRQMQKL